MIAEIITYRCPRCGSLKLVKNGHDYKGAQKYHCKECGAYGTLKTKKRAAEAQRQQAIDAYF